MPKKKLTKAKQYKKLEGVFNRYIRLRDCKGQPGTHCISCGKWTELERLHAGHYVHGKRVVTRFDERNVNAECAGCNTFDSNHLISYRINLVNKIGEDGVKDIEGIRFQPLKMSPTEIQEKTEDYKLKLKELEQDRT